MVILQVNNDKKYAPLIVQIDTNCLKYANMVQRLHKKPTAIGEIHL